MTREAIGVLVLSLAASAVPVYAQTPPAAKPAASSASEIRVGSRVGVPPTTYDDGGRRDPFISLIVPKPSPTASPAASMARPAAGLGGVSVSDIAVKGMIRSGNTLIALLQGPDGRTYMAKKSDRLQDAVVTRIDNDGVVFTERVADAAGVVHARDVRKPLRAAVSGGQ